MTHNQMLRVLYVLSQAKQKAQHDSHTKGKEFSVGESIMAKNFRTGAPWLPVQLLRDSDL